MTNFQHNRYNLLLWIKPQRSGPLKGKPADSDTPLNEPFWKPQKPYPAPQQCSASSFLSSFPGTDALPKGSERTKRVRSCYCWTECVCVQHQLHCLSVEIGRAGLHAYCLDWWMVHAWRPSKVSSFPTSTGRRLTTNFPLQHFRNGLKRTASGRKMSSFQTLTFNWDKSTTSTSQWPQPCS